MRSSEVRLLYERERELHPSIAAAINAKSTVAFFSFAPSNGAVLAAGLDGLYRLDTSQTTFIVPYPPAEMRGPFGVSFAVPGVVLIARHGPSGWGEHDGPLLVAR